jgi:short subunit dehydrogenase-like uncharacterized protein
MGQNKSSTEIDNVVEKINKGLMEILYLCYSNLSVVKPGSEEDTIRGILDHTQKAIEYVGPYRLHGKTMTDSTKMSDSVSTRDNLRLVLEDQITG